MDITLSRFLQWKPNVFVYRKLGWRFTSSYLFFLGGLYFKLRRQERKKIACSVQAVFGAEKTPSELKDLNKRILQGILSHYFEKVFNAYEGLPALTSFMSDHISAPSIHKVEEALKRKKGVLFVTGHYGGVEYIPIFLAMHGFPVSVVFKCATSQLQDTLERRAQELGIHVIDPSQENALGAVLQNLRENRVVFTQCDEIEAWKPSRKEEMLFLGKRIGVDRTLTLLQRRTGAEIVFGLLQRLNPDNYLFVIETYHGSASRSGTVPCSPAAALLKLLEHYIYTCPEGWYQWKHHASIKPSALPQKASRDTVPVPFLKPSFRTT